MPTDCEIIMSILKFANLLKGRGRERKDTLVYWVILKFFFFFLLSIVLVIKCCWNYFKEENSKAAAAAAKSLQSCPTLCNPIDGSPPGSPVPGILQARTLEWAAISVSNAWKWKVKVKSLSRVRLLATPWTVAHQGPPSMGFSRQEES